MTAATKRATKARLYAAACAAVDWRSGGFCEAAWEGVCLPGRHRAQVHHHMILRSRGGPDEDWNLLAMCDASHRYAHDHPAEATERGVIRRLPV